MRHRFLLILVALTLGLGGVGAAHGTPTGKSPSGAVKTCKRGYVHAIIDRKQKCLHSGQFCAVRFERQYRRYGFTCRGRLRRR